MAKRNVPAAGHSGPSREKAVRLREAESLAAHRLVSFLGRIRNRARKTLDAIQSKAFLGSLDEVLPVTPEDVNVAVSYLVELGLCHEEAQQLRRECEWSWDAGGFLQLLMRIPPPVLDYSASDDDPDDPEVARVKQVNAERFADHQRKIDDQRGIAIDAVSALLKHVDDLVEAVESVSGGDEGAAEDAEFQWTAPLLEGHVSALLREVKYPTQRVAVEWVADKSRKPPPSRATLCKTWAWQNRPPKTPRPHTTNEAQSGVSPAQNADAAVPHEEVTNAVLDIEEKLHRQLKDDERAAVAWTLQQAGPGEEERRRRDSPTDPGF